MSQEERDAIYAQILGMVGDVGPGEPSNQSPLRRRGLWDLLLLAGVIVLPVASLIPILVWGQALWWLQFSAGAVAGGCLVLLLGQLERTKPPGAA